MVLVHDADVDVAPVAARVWYPLWDGGVRLDHAVRSLPQVTGAARVDVRTALGLLDARHLAGDPAVTLRLRADLLAHWRRDARRTLPALKELVHARHARHGELGHAAVPDLKESSGGLRDVTVLTALVASWLVDVPHRELVQCRRQLLDLRDALHDVAGRPTDRVAPDLWEDLAATLGLPDGTAAQRLTRGVGRRATHLSRLTWRRVDAVLERPRRGSGRRAPSLQRVGLGVAVADGEVVLDRNAEPSRDPLLLLRAAVEAAERRLVLSPPTAARLAREGRPVPEPWGRSARDLLTRLLAAGPGLLPVWETLEETAALERILPEWQRVRLLPHASPVHRFTVDRHLVETCIEASRMLRRVDRPDVLMVAALLHDIGKGTPGDHSVLGARVAASTARRLGYDEPDVAAVATLVREHLLLAETATARDLEDPATVQQVTDRVGGVRTLRMLEVLTEADARATASQAWSTWRAGLVRELVRRVEACLAVRADGPEAGRPAEEPPTDEPPTDEPLADGPPAVPVPAAVRNDPGRVAASVTHGADGSRVTVLARDRVGLLAAVAGGLAALRLTVRAVRAWTRDDLATSVWDLAQADADPAIVRQRVEAVLAGRLDPAARLCRPAEALGPSVAVRPEASRSATVLEVRTGDRPGVLFLVCAALARLDLSVRSAHAATLGPQAVDVFYVQEPGAGRLTDERAAAAVHAVRRALGSPGYP